MRTVVSLWRGKMVIPDTKREIAIRTAIEHNIALEDLMGASRARRFSWPRQQAMYEMAMKRLQDGRYRWSYPAIAAFFGMDHTSIFYGAERHAERNGLPSPKRAGDPWRLAA